MFSKDTKRFSYIITILEIFQRKQQKCIVFNFASWKGFGTVCCDMDGICVCQTGPMGAEMCNHTLHSPETFVTFVIRFFWHTLEPFYKVVDVLKGSRWFVPNALSVLANVSARKRNKTRLQFKDNSIKASPVTCVNTALVKLTYSFQLSPSTGYLRININCFFFPSSLSYTIETDKHLPPTLTVPTLQQLFGANRFAMLQYTDPITGSTLAINFQLKITIMPITCTHNHIISIFCHYTVIVITPQYTECFARGICTQSHSHFPSLL